MNKIKNMSESSFLKLFFLVVSLFFVVAAVIMPDRAAMLSDLKQILTTPCKVTTNYFALGGFAATFLNMGLVGLFCWALCQLPGAKAGNVFSIKLKVITLAHFDFNNSIFSKRKLILIEKVCCCIFN